MAKGKGGGKGGGGKSGGKAPNPNYPSTNPGQKSGTGRGNVKK
jgi:hypothetical protein